MTSDNGSATALLTKIQNLPPEQVQAVERFVDELLAEAERKAWVAGAMQVSEAAFAAVWDNPTVAIGLADYHRVYGDVMVMALTSQMSRPVLLGELVVQDWPGAGLLKPSLVKPVVATVQKSLVLRRLGQLQAVDRDAVSRVLPTILGL